MRRVRLVPMLIPENQRFKEACMLVRRSSTKDVRICPSTIMLYSEHHDGVTDIMNTSLPAKAAPQTVASGCLGAKAAHKNPTNIPAETASPGTNAPSKLSTLLRTFCR